MNYRYLGSTGLKVSEIGFGSWAIGGAGYGDTDDKVSKKALNKALDLGVNFIDTADSYGNGHSEDIIGEVLEARRDTETLVCTKFGWDFYSQSGIKSNLDKNYIRFALQKSRDRLKRDIIDVYLIHSSNPKNIEHYGAVDTLNKLKSEGLIRYLGISISEYYFEQTLPVIENLNPDVIEVKFNLLCNDAKAELFNLCYNKGIGIIVREPLANGLLSGKYSKDSRFLKNDHRNGFKKEFLEQQINKVNMIKKYFRSNSEMVRGAIKYTLEFPQVSVVIPGAKTVQQVEQNISSLDYDFNLGNFNKENLMYL